MRIFLKCLRHAEHLLLLTGATIAMLFSAPVFALAFATTSLHDRLAKGTEYERGLLNDYEDEPNMLAAFFGIGRKHEFQKRLEDQKQKTAPMNPGLMEAIRKEQEVQYIPKHLRPQPKIH